jgi:hypothetical protein
VSITCSDYLFIERWALMNRWRPEVVHDLMKAARAEKAPPTSTHKLDDGRWHQITDLKAPAPRRWFLKEGFMGEGWEVLDEDLRIMERQRALLA